MIWKKYLKNLKKKLGHDIPTNVKIYYRNYYLNRIKELKEIYYEIFEPSQIKKKENNEPCV